MDAEGFWRYVNRSSPDGCWPWMGSRDKWGYGGAASRLSPGRIMHAHRVAWEIHHNIPLERGAYVCHHCDNPACCNPAHLYLGDAKTNARDRVERGREGDRSGEKNGGAKLTVDQVRAIRADGRPSRAVARDYGVCKSTVLLIRQGTTWTKI